MDLIDLAKAQMQFHKTEYLMIFLNLQNEYLSSDYKQTIMHQQYKNCERQVENARKALLGEIENYTQDTLSELINKQNKLLSSLEEYQKQLSKHREYSVVIERHFMKPATTHHIPGIIFMLGITNEQIDLEQKNRRCLDELAKLYSEIEDVKTKYTMITYDGKIKTDEAIAIALFKTLNPKMPIDRVYDIPKHFSNPKDYGFWNKQEVEDSFNSFSLLSYVMNEKDLTTKLFPNGIPNQFMDDVKHFIHHDDSHVLSDIVSCINSMDITPSQKLESAVEIIQKYYIEPYIEKGYLPEQYQDGLEMINEEFQRNYEERLKFIEQRIQDNMKNYPNIEKGIIILPEPSLPWQDIACRDPDAKLVIEPCDVLKDGFCLHSVPFEPGSSDVRCPVVGAHNSIISLDSSHTNQHEYYKQFDKAIINAGYYIRQYEKNKRDVLENIQAGASLEDVPNEYKNDVDVVIAAVKNDPNELQFASNSLKKNPEVLNEINEVSTHNEAEHRSDKNIGTNMTR